MPTLLRTPDEYVDIPHLPHPIILTDMLQIVEAIHKQHNRDPNFPIEIITKIEEFLGTRLFLNHLPPGGSARGHHNQRISIITCAEAPS